MATQRPIHKLHRGSLTAAIWANESDNGVFHTVTLTRCYSGPDDKPRDTNGLRRRDLLPAAKLLDAAESWIEETRRTQKAAASA